MHSRLTQNLHTNNMLVTVQYSFRKGISTEDARNFEDFCSVSNLVLVCRFAANNLVKFR